MEPVAGPPPPLEADEWRLMRRIDPTHLVSKNSGGAATKLDIARALGIAVVMVARPAQPPGPTVGDPVEALRWLVALLDRDAPLAER
jgi:precorrin-6A/cobalt-precorrin-6A reductase